MKKLSELYDVNSDVSIKGIKINSKEIEKGDLFVCTMGVTADRHDFIDMAIENGASAIVVSRDVPKKSVPLIKVDNTNEELSKICQKFYDYPNKELKMIGVTGTDGKTTTATIIQTLIGKNDCGYIGTNGRSWKDKVEDDNPNTTPDETVLYRFLRDFREDDCSYAVMEASSEAYFRKRLNNLEYDISCYTNITSEHLNIHGSFENYLDCKKQTFKNTKSSGYCILNRDDSYYEDMLAASNGTPFSYGTDKNADLQIVDYEIYSHKTNITFSYQEKEYQIESPLVGEFNVYNLAAGLLVCLSLGFSMSDLIPRIKDIKVSGRMELLDTKTPYYVMVDYAHTPNGIKNLLKFVHTLDINRSIVVIGQAGERDYLKRPKVGNTVVENASYAIFTYEDPRSEDPKDICEDIIKELKEKHDNYEIVLDRHEAIEKAIAIAKEKDMVLILGKGNETYQKLKKETIYFNDIEEAYLAVKKRKEKEGIEV